MSTAHIFYIPVLVLVGVFGGYFIGRWRAEEDERERRKAQKRAAAIRNAARENSGD